MQFTLQGTNTYIVGTGSNRLIIDTGQGLPEWIPLIESTLRDNTISLSHVLLTHWHGDHTGGVPDLIRLYPYLSTAIFKHTPGRNQNAIEDSQVFNVEGATIRALHTPGHSHDHMCFVLEEENALFTGDNLLGHGTAAVENLSTWMNTLRKMGDSGTVKGYPAHGDVIADLPLKISEELAQKTRREDRVLRILNKVKQEESSAGRGKGSVTVKQLVAAMHGSELDGQVREQAIEPFTEEILKKLAEDEKVAFELRRGEKKWFAIAAA